jgi:L-ascorbate metabolism protein UlaG (beta-lactamase superfamily)
LYIGGDSGYDTHFRAIGDKYGPFDIVMLECGQYNQGWKFIHLMPEQVVTAAQDLRARMLLPVHWGKFTLSLHAWDEPIRRLTAEATRKQQPLTTPRIGEPIILDNSYPAQHWWEQW